MSTLAALLPAVPALGWAVHARWLHGRLTTARRDPLTALWTRDAFTHRARRLLRDPRAVVVLADVDHFKQINDTHGHAAGDLLLATVAARLAHSAAPGGVAGRLGGDEFAAVVIDRDGTMADRLHTLARVLARPVDTAPDVHTTVSLGWVRAGDHPGEDLSALLRRADEAMYAAKRSGRSGPRRARLGRLLGSVAGRRPGRHGAA
ncbi:GGDEF domain-containing protein [Streptomyces sp900105755]|uniref:GGDEF domain-containing protein n=1 Tax=Streptomyces doudnae TaxID=3075536 RepID=A0ABD5EKH5_9ACTN|nr:MULTISPECIES: GGDEF domain-containing protein [unclassified Streptomyces]MDT0435188.1 GGDEF domain-containing protein [Streptomyces sp. DSM 41981]MYQ65411.1 diguanylate cyclase [Streptomyces sp. SID4950]SCD99051.1 diguanylate cyclase (GGDEF) domain-containing protein [Streptomyces sp. SolWspMP-5a-2]